MVQPQTALPAQFPRELRNFVDRRDLAGFWAEVEQKGTPIIEPIADASNFRVTFLARGLDDTKSFTGNGAGFYWKETSFDRVPNTDIWFAQVEVPRGLVGSYVLLRDLPPGTDYWDQRKFAHPDVFNRTHKLDWTAWPKATGAPYTTFVFEAPGATPAQYLETPQEKIKGQRHLDAFSSSILDNTRDVYTYLPRGFTPQKPIPLVIAFDGSSYFHGINLPDILDNMIAAGAIPPVAAVCPCSIDTPSRNRELPCNADFVRMLTDELLPYAAKAYGITPTGQPIILAGSSYGGLASLYGAFARPDLFTHVLSQAGAFYWGPNDFKDGISWLPKEIERTGVLPKKLYMDAGTRDNMFTTDGKHPDNLSSNRSFKDQLDRMGYQDCRYDEYVGGHDYACWQRTLPIGLAWLLGSTY